MRQLLKNQTYVGTIYIRYIRKKQAYINYLCQLLQCANFIVNGVLISKGHQNFVRTFETLDVVDREVISFTNTIWASKSRITGVVKRYIAHNWSITIQNNLLLSTLQFGLWSLSDGFADNFGIGTKALRFAFENCRLDKETVISINTGLICEESTTYLILLHQSQY